MSVTPTEEATTTEEAATTAPKKRTPAKAKEQAQPTKYVILRLNDGGGWVPQDETVTATNKDTALRRFTKPLSEGGEFKAVAASAWVGGLKVGKREVTETTYEEITDY
jgi:hypothetical protein